MWGGWQSPQVNGIYSFFFNKNNELGGGGSFLSKPLMEIDLSHKGSGSMVEAEVYRNAFSASISRVS